MTTAVASNPFAAVNAANAAASASASAAASSSSTLGAGSTAMGSQDAFLKLLTTQMQNQDPLNPMDNAQVTSQIAQINTVTGIQQLNSTVGGLNTQLVQMQTLQGASLVGHDVTVAGNRLAIANGVGTGGFQLTNGADDVQVQVMDANGSLVSTLDLGAQQAGNQSFNWTAANVPDGANYSFKVTATSGGNPLSVTPLMQDHVTSVTAGTNGLTLNTEYSGAIAYPSIVSFD